MISPATMTAEEARCETHGIAFTKIFVPGFDVWTGDCPACVKAKAVEAEAARQLDTPEVQAREEKETDKRMKKLEPQIQKQTDEELAVYAESIRPQIEADVTWRTREWVSAEVHAEMKETLARELQASAQKQEV